jgi:tripartite-type tricarboxylate transporter receptor subunit TctC
MPDVPTLDEIGLKGFASISWSGVVAPAGTSAAVLEKINGAINAELQAGDMRQALLQLGAEVKAGTPDDFARFIAAEVPKWAEVVRSSGMKLQ